MRRTRTVILRSHTIYNELGLEEGFHEGGKARSAWRAAALLRATGRDVEAAEYEAEAEKTRIRRGGDPAKVDRTEDDFNVLLNYMDT